MNISTRFVWTEKKVTEKMRDSDLQCPVFYPTDADLKMGWEAYIRKIEKNIRVAGVGKIVPPRSWVPRADGYKDVDFVIQKPVRCDAVLDKTAAPDAVLLAHCSRECAENARAAGNS